ncbi:MAG: bifunctional phosphopantothenoylcysteine decarboxylase/phosphopantothenate--cysteine ligase CoaBC [Candidatus Diapherotrites archaeon]|nr:bifunctional phosphopantothenoylcysteine decarboxylase/phosphopantothenate--cysteine ligase CoaBC [Candidatus Diapherotrites archaeon]
MIKNYKKVDECYKREININATKNKRLKGKTVVLAICGSVACIKSFELCRELIRKGANVKVVMSDAALKLISKDMMEYASDNDVITSLSGKVEHVQLLGLNGKADLLLIAPATSNTISKIAMGIDDTPITTMAITAIGSKKPVLVVPAMHYAMYDHPIVKENLNKLEKRQHIKIIKPIIEEGKAKFANIENICLEVERELSEKNMLGKKVLIISGKSYEEIDDVRVITNKATGKTGLEIAKECYRQGADVNIIHNEIIGLPFKEEKAESYKEFREKTLDELKKEKFDLIIIPAALSDFCTEKKKGKIGSKKEISIKLKPNKKLLDELQEYKRDTVVVVFKLEDNKKNLEIEAKKIININKAEVVVGNTIKDAFKEEKEVVIISKNEKKIVRGDREKISKELISFLSKNFK